MTYTCSCGDSYTESIPTTEHDFRISGTTRNPDPLWHYIICDLCGEYVYNDTGAIMEHCGTYHPDVDSSTFSPSGVPTYVGYDQCSICGY